MSAGLIALEGTAQDAHLALVLALLAAVVHVYFGALQKGRHNPWLARAAIDASYAIMAAPFALFVELWPEPHMWAIFAGAVAIQIVDKLLQAMAYARGVYTVVHPVVRGTGPFLPSFAQGWCLVRFTPPCNGPVLRCWWRVFSSRYLSALAKNNASAGGAIGAKGCIGGDGCLPRPCLQP